MEKENKQDWKKRKKEKKMMKIAARREESIRKNAANSSFLSHPPPSSSLGHNQTQKNTGKSNKMIKKNIIRNKRNKKDGRRESKPWKRWT